MATIARRRSSEARRLKKTAEHRPKERVTPKKEQGRISRFIENRLKASAVKRDQALAKTEAKKISPTERLKLDAIEQRRGAATKVARETIQAIVEEEKRYIVVSGSAMEASPDHADKCEDWGIVENEPELFAVIDGKSFPPGNDVVADDIATKVFQKWRKVDMSTIQSETDAQREMRFIMVAVNNEINEKHNYQKKSNEDRLGAAATIVKLLTLPNGKRIAVVGHTGDTRLYVQKGDGTLKQKTTDHGRVEYFLGLMHPETAAILRAKFANLRGDPAQTLDGQTRLAMSDGRLFGHGVTELWLYNQGNILTQSFGQIDGYNPQITSFEVEEGSRLLLTSDGIHDLVPDNIIAECLSSGASATEQARNLVNDSKAGLRIGAGGKINDDRTAIVIEPKVDRLAGEVALAKKEYRDWAETSEHAEAGSTEPLPVPVTKAQQEGLAALMVELRSRGSVLHRVIINGAEQRYAKLLANDIDTSDYWRDAGLKEIFYNKAIKLKLAPVDLAVVDRRGIYEAKVKDMIAAVDSVDLSAPATNVLRESVKYIETTEIAQDAVLLNAVMSVLEQVAGRSSETEVTVATLVTNSAVQELAKKLSFNAETVAELLINQVQAIGEAARQQEKAQRSLGLNIAKAAGYGLAGLGLATSMIATPMAAVAGIGVARALDAFVTTRVHEKNRKKIEAAMQKQLKDMVLAFKAQADAERTYDKVKEQPELHHAVDSFVALLALAKRDQINGPKEFETDQDRLTELVEQATQGDASAKADYDTIVQQAANNLYDRRIEELKVTMGEPEASNLSEAKEAYFKYHDQTDPNTPGAQPRDNDKLDRLRQAWADMYECYDIKMDQIDRIAAAERALYVHDKTTQLVEAQARLSADSRKSFWDKHPSLRALVGGGETAKEKVASIGVFMGLGFIARQSNVSRIVLSGYAGARAGEALARLEERYHQAVEDQRAKLETADLDAIDLNSPEIFVQLDALAPRVAVARRRLVGGDLRTKNPAEFMRVLQLVERFDSLRVTAEARRSVYRVAYHTDEIFEAHAKNVSGLEKSRKHIRRCAVLGAVAGGLLGVETAELIAQRAETMAHGQAIPAGEAAGATGSLSGVDSTAADGSTADDSAAGVTSESSARTVAESSEPAGSGAPDVATRPVESVGTDTSSSGVDTGASVDTAAAASTTHLVEGWVLSNNSVELPGIRTLTEREWHAAVIHGGEGVWHALKEQAEAPKILTLLKETKIKMPDGDMPIFDPEHGTQLGVRTPDNLAVILHKDAAGHETLRFFNAQTHKEIPADDLHEYFYKMSIHTEVVAPADVSSGTAAAGAVVPDASVPSSTASATEGVSGLARSLWHDGMTRTQFIDAYLNAHRPPLDDTMGTVHDTALQHAPGRSGSGFSGQGYSADARMSAEANRAYVAISAHNVGDDSDADPLAAATTGARVEPAEGVVTGSGVDAAGGSAGGGGPVADPASPGSRSMEPRPVVVNADGALSAGERAALDFSKRSYRQDDYDKFLYNAKTLLVEVGGRKPSFTSDNNLVFSTRGAGAVYVDVPHTRRPPELLTEPLYQTIQRHYETVIRGQDRTAISVSDWETIMRAYKETQRGARTAA